MKHSKGGGGGGGYRRGDPPTSKDAAETAATQKIRDAMMFHLDQHPEGLTCTELEVLTGIKRDAMTPRIPLMRLDGIAVATNLTRCYGDRPGETWRAGQHKHCTVYKSTKFDIPPEEIVPLPPPSLLDDLTMKATSSPHFHMTTDGNGSGWTGVIKSLDIHVWAKYQGAARSAARSKVRDLLAPIIFQPDDDL
jgi:hypothetical protein